MKSEDRAVLIQKVRRVDNNYVVVIPQDEIERQGIAKGDLVTVEIHRVTSTLQISPEVQAAFERSLHIYDADYKYLRSH